MSPTMELLDLAFPAGPSLMSAAANAITIDIDGSVFIQLGLFFVLFLAIKPLLLDPFLRLMEEREKRTEGAKKQAREMEDEIHQLEKAYAAKLEEVRRIAAEEREKRRAEAQKLEAKIFQEAHEEAQKIIEEGKRDLARQADAIREELKQTSASLSKQIVAKVLSREVSS